MQYNSEMEAVARKFPVSEEEMSAIHTKYYDVAFEKLMLSNSGPATENSPKRPVEDRIRSKKERALLAAAKQRFVDMNDSAGTVPYLTQLGGNRHGPLSEDAAVKFINSIIAACNSEANATKQIKLAAAAICQRVGGPGEDMVKLAAVKAEADSAMEAQIGANRLLGSRVEELERENSELHRILDDNTNKALDSWSSGQLKIAKLEEEVKNTKEEKKASDKAAADAKEEIKQLEIKLERLKAKMEAFVDEEKKEVRVSFMTMLCSVYVTL